MSTEENTKSITINRPGSDPQENNLFPVFLKLEHLRLLLVGGGNVALEKLLTVLNNSPTTQIKLVALSISEEIRQLALRHQILICTRELMKTVIWTGWIWQLRP
jgi:siroheme synthase (precorrin-2 oxidase/ferrochelatase)